MTKVARLQQASATQHLGATLCLRDVRPLQRSLVTGTGAARSKPLISMWLTGKRPLAPDCQALSLLTLPQLVGAGAVPTSCPQFSIGGELPGRTPPTSAVHPMATGVPPPSQVSRDWEPMCLEEQSLGTPCPQYHAGLPRPVQTTFPCSSWTPVNSSMLGPQSLHAHATLV
jgi:hypothetical protein